MMEDTKKKLAHIRCPPVNKEADILDQLQCCDIYFQHIANNTSVTGNLSQFYENVQVSMCHCAKFVKMFWDFYIIFFKIPYVVLKHI